jgi:hypothetical protein
MSASLGEVVAQLRAVVTSMDEAVAVAFRAQVDAKQACACYVEAAVGTRHPTIRRAISDSRTGWEKAAKTARLLAEAANALTEYVNIVVSGSVPPGVASPDAMPSGEALLAEAEERESRAAKFHRKGTEAIGDQDETMARYEESSRDIVARLKGQHGSGGTQATVGTPQGKAVFKPAPADTLNPVTAVILAAAGAGLAARGIAKKIKKSREWELPHDGQT